MTSAPDELHTVSLAEARAAGSKFYFTAQPCGYGHIAERYVNNSACKACQRARDKLKYANADKPAYMAQQRKACLRRRYAMTVADYEALLKQQNGVCAICNRTEKVTRNGKTIRLGVDHCHIIGHVRGLLCNSCNKYVMGMLDNTPGALERLLQYLKR